MKRILLMDLIAAEERFRQIVAGSYFSSMRMGVCAFSGDILPIRTVGHFAMTGCDNTHPIPRGFIPRGTEYEYLMPICSFKNMINNKMLAVEYTDLPENVKIPRLSVRERQHKEFQRDSSVKTVAFTAN